MTKMHPATAYKKALRRFYDRESIAVDQFNCPHTQSCRYAVGGELWKGSEAHIGAKYGSPFRLVIVSMDRGKGSENIENRTREIESIDPNNANPHMRGTADILCEILNVSRDRSIWHHFAMTNSAKCCSRGGGMTAAPRQLFDNCADFSIGEMEMLRPDVIVTQGERAGIAFDRNGLSYWENLNDTLIEKIISAIAGSRISKIESVLRTIIDDYVSLLHFSYGSCLWFYLIHPSQRSNRWKEFSRCQLVLLGQIARTWIEMEGRSTGNHQEVIA